MRKYLALMKVSLSSMLLSGVGRKNGKRRKMTGTGIAVGIAILGIYMSGMYSALLLTVLEPLGMEVLLFVLMGLAALASGLLFTAFGVSKVVFGGKDNDFMLSMPISSSALMLTRVFAIYAENWLFSFFMLVPAGVVCAFMTTTNLVQTLGFWLRILLTTMLLPLLDTALSVVFGAVIAWISAKITHKAIGQNVLMGVFMVAIFAFAFNLNGMMERLSIEAPTLIDSMQWAKPIVWMGQGILGDWRQLGLFALACMLPFALMIICFGKLYRKAVTVFASMSARSDYKLMTQRNSGQIKALLKKEAQRFFGTPSYFWNYAMGLMMLMVLAILAAIKRENLTSLFDVFGAELDRSLLPMIAAYFGFCLSMSPICAPSVSLEGKNLWILKASPVRTSTILGVKWGFQYLIAMPCILIAVPIFAFVFKMNGMDMLTLLVFAVSFEIGVGCFGMLMGLYFAKLDCDDRYIVKTSLLTFLSMFAPMIILLLGGLLIWLIGKIGSVSVGIFAALALTVLFAGISAAVLVKQGEKLFNNLY